MAASSWQLAARKGQKQRASYSLGKSPRRCTSRLAGRLPVPYSQSNMAAVEQKQSEALQGTAAVRHGLVRIAARLCVVHKSIALGLGAAGAAPLPLLLLLLMPPPPPAMPHPCSSCCGAAAACPASQLTSACSKAGRSRDSPQMLRSLAPMQQHAVRSQRRRHYRRCACCTAPWQLR